MPKRGLTFSPPDRGSYPSSSILDQPFKDAVGTDVSKF